MVSFAIIRGKMSVLWDNAVVSVATKKVVEAMDIVLVIEEEVESYMEEEYMVIGVNLWMDLISVTLISSILMNNVRDSKNFEQNIEPSW